MKLFYNSFFMLSHSGFISITIAMASNVYMTREGGAVKVLISAISLGFIRSRAFTAESSIGNTYFNSFSASSYKA